MCLHIKINNILFLVINLFINMCNKLNVHLKIIRKYLNKKVHFIQYCAIIYFLLFFL